MQALREEEEEKIAEEESIDDIQLTYDRPDLCSKVTLRRSSTGMWKVCSSGQIFENELSHSVKEKGPVCKAKTAQKVDSEETSKNRVLRSGKCHGVGVTTTLNSVRSKENFDDDPDYSPVNYPHKNAMKDDVANQSSRSLRNSSELPGDYSSRNNSICKTGVLLGGDAELKVVPSERVECRDPVVLRRNGSSTSSEDSMSVEPRDNSAVGHKYPTRQKPVLHNDGGVV